MHSNAPKFLQGWNLVGTLSLAIVAAALGITWWHQGDVEGVRLVIRVTARTSLLLFALAFTASALHRLWPNEWTRWQRKNRRYLGVSFAASHGVHAVGIAAFALLDPVHYHQHVTLGTYVTAGLAYAFIVAMTITSFDTTAAVIGPRAWRILHTTGAYYIWLSFLSAFGKRVPLDPFYWPFATFVVLLLLVRVAAYVLTKREVSRGLA
jgi:methionine sulfoxide reductase heme-binding subunit